MVLKISKETTETLIKAFEELKKSIEESIKYLTNLFDEYLKAIETLYVKKFIHKTPYKTKCKLVKFDQRKRIIQFRSNHKKG